MRFSNNETWQISSISVHARVSDAVVLSVYAVDPGTNLPTGAALQQVPLTSTNGQFEFIEASVNLTLSPGTYAVLLSVEDGADSNSAIVKKHTSNGFTDFIYEYQNEWYQHGSYRFRFVIKGTTD